jgi:hypothetical protein
MTTTHNATAFMFKEEIAPSGTTAAGPRVGLGVAVTQWGTNTNAGITSGEVVNLTMASNLGGTSTNYLGAGNGFNAVCHITSTSTDTLGCSVQENDSEADSGSSYSALTQLLLVTLPGNAVEGYLNENVGIMETGGIGVTTGLLKKGIQFGAVQSSSPMDPYGILIWASPKRSNGALQAAGGVDVSHSQFSAFTAKGPFSEDVPLQASGITGATRLTSDGNAASSYLLEANMNAGGSGYTSQPTITVSGCTSAAVNAVTGLGNVLGQAGVYTPGSSCGSNASASVSGGGGSSATINLVVAGNTLNFATNSAIQARCDVNAYSSGLSLGIGWTITFGATQGATPGTTAIVGSPTWTQTYASTGAASDISIAAPTADTTLGALNLTVTPSTGTWSVGGICHLTSTAQVI